MKGLPPALAAVVGLAVVLGVSFAGQLVTSALLAAPDGAPLPVGRTFLSATLAIAFGASVLGGAVGTHVASAAKGRVMVGIAVLSALLGVVSATSAPPGTPAVVAWALPFLAFVGALGGGAVRALNRSPRSSV